MCRTTVSHIVTDIEKESDKKEPWGRKSANRNVVRNDEIS